MDQNDAQKPGEHPKSNAVERLDKSKASDQDSEKLDDVDYSDLTDEDGIEGAYEDGEVEKNHTVRAKRPKLEYHKRGHMSQRSRK